MVGIISPPSPERPFTITKIIECLRTTAQHTTSGRPRLDSLYRYHHLRLFSCTLSETVAGAPGQREHEYQDSDNTHDLISST
jgi:hypothetical protein